MYNCGYCKAETDELKHWKAIKAIQEWVHTGYDQSWISIHDIANTVEKIFTEE